MYSAFCSAAQTQQPQLKILQGENLKNHTSFRIGGPAKIMVFPSDTEELSFCLREFSAMGKTPRILGAGTNVLAPDEGVEEPIVCLKDRFAQITPVSETELEAYAGATLCRLALAARDASLTGLEFAHGIPGTVGGGVYMNAGAYGGELKQVVSKVTVMHPDGSMEDRSVEDGTFGYRTSIFEHSDDIVVKAVFRLAKGKAETISAAMTELMEKRKASQPLELPSAGSTFKRPAGGYAAALIDEAGLKGFRVGDAAVSEKHAGFVVNLGAATAGDVKTLMEEIQKIVEERSGIRLSPEVRIW